jgi:hypothetical protein
VRHHIIKRHEDHEIGPVIFDATISDDWLAEFERTLHHFTLTYAGHRPVSFYALETAAAIQALRDACRKN